MSRRPPASCIWIAEAPSVLLQNANAQVYSFALFLFQRATVSVFTSHSCVHRRQTVNAQLGREVACLSMSSCIAGGCLCERNPSKVSSLKSSKKEPSSKAPVNLLLKKLIFPKVHFNCPCVLNHSDSLSC